MNKSATIRETVWNKTFVWHFRIKNCCYWQIFHLVPITLLKMRLLLSFCKFGKLSVRKGEWRSKLSQQVSRDPSQNLHLGDFNQSFAVSSDALFLPLQESTNYSQPITEEHWNGAPRGSCPSPLHWCCWWCCFSCLRRWQQRQLGNASGTHKVRPNSVSAESRACLLGIRPFSWSCLIPQTLLWMREARDGGSRVGSGLQNP